MSNYKNYIKDESVIARVAKYVDLLADYDDNRDDDDYDDEKLSEVFDICEAIYFFSINFYASDLNPWLKRLEFKAGLSLSQSKLSLIHSVDYRETRNIYLDLVRHSFIEE
jgi:hypothetical protein